MSVIDSALGQIKDLHPYSPGKPVEELERELGISHAFKLASNENPLGCSKGVSKAIAKAAANIELYPDANAFYLKQKLAEKLGIGSDQITIGNGSNDVLDLIARTFLDASASAVFSEYAFMVYSMVTQACGAESRIAAANSESHGQPLGHDLEAMLSKISDNTRLVFVANPNNPTGTWLESDELFHFISSVPDNIAIVIDEAYFEYVELEAYPDSLEWIRNFPNLIVTRTFSKIYGLAGLRVGYCISSPELCNLFNRVRQPFNGNSLGLAAACAALDDETFVETSRRVNRIGLERLQSWFDQRKIGYLPSAGNFLTVKFGERSSQINQQLMQRGIIVRPVGNYGMPDYLRISVGTEEQLESMFTILDEIL